MVCSTYSTFIFSNRFAVFRFKRWHGILREVFIVTENYYGGPVLVCCLTVETFLGIVTVMTGVETSQPF